MDTQTFGKCFYTALGTVEFAKTMKSDFGYIKEDASWFTAIVYNSFKMGQNIAASYE